MSQTSDPSAKDASRSAKRRRAVQQLVDMMQRGRSFSGRERNCCFLNNSSGRFATVSAVSGLDFPDDARATAVVDWDQDGDLDLWIANRNAPRLRLMRNNATRRGGFLAFQLQGNGTSTSRDAIGARVEVVAAELKGQRLIRTLRAGEGFLSQASKTVHFGLGGSAEIEKVIVNWPGGAREQFTGITPNGRYRLVQGTGQARRVPRRANVQLRAEQQPKAKRAGAVRVPLVTRLPLPPPGRLHNIRQRTEAIAVREAGPADIDCVLGELVPPVLE